MPASARTLGELRFHVRLLADIQNSQVWSETEVGHAINMGIGDLWDLLIASNGQPWIEKYAELTTTAGTSVMALPADLYILRGVDVDIDGTPYPLRPYSNADRHQGFNGTGWSGLGGITYRLFGATSGASLSESGGAGYITDSATESFQIRFTPTPSGAHTVRIWYVPQPPELSGSDELSGWNSTWWEYAEYQAVVRIKDSMELDSTPERLRIAELANRIRTQVSQRDQAFPERVQDTSHLSYWTW